MRRQETGCGDRGFSMIMREEAGDIRSVLDVTDHEHGASSALRTRPGPARAVRS
jgi:hypothetical protein